MKQPLMTKKTLTLRWVATSELVEKASQLAGLLPHDVIGVAGIPRSGMIPASVIATHLHVPLWELDIKEGLKLISSGSRGYSFDKVKREGRIAVIDDTVFAGTAMKKARELLNSEQVIYAAVYVRPETRHKVDYHAEILPSPHLLEWNVMNNGPFRGMAYDKIYGEGIACDFDGILCHDAESGGRLGSPYLVPRMFSCRLIITGRPERHRPETEKWLRDWGVRWDRLEMLPDNAKNDAQTIAGHKSRYYAASNCGFFMESDPIQAEMIYNLTRKPVICPILKKVWPEKAVVLMPAYPYKDPEVGDGEKCVCSGAGFCPLYQRNVTEMEYQLCSCTCEDERICTPPLCERRRRRWLHQAQSGTAVLPATDKPLKMQESTSHGVGTELKELLKVVGFKAGINCKCNQRAALMDEWGIATCEVKREEILSWLREEQAKKGWLDKMKAAGRAVMTGLAFSLNPLDPAASLLDEAFRRARAKEDAKNATPS